VPDDIAEVYSQYYPALVRFLYRQGLGRRSARRISRSRRRFDAGPGPSAGEYTRLVFVVAAEYGALTKRAGGTGKKTALTLLKSEPDAVNSTPEDGHRMPERRNAWRAAARRATPRDREALLLWEPGCVTTRSPCRRGWRAAHWLETHWRAGAPEHGLAPMSKDWKDGQMSTWMRNAHRYLDGELPPVERTALETHLADCATWDGPSQKERALRERASAGWWIRAPGGARSGPHPSNQLGV